MIEIENHNVYELNDLSNPELVNILKEGLDSIPISNYRGMEENYLYQYKDTPGNLFRILDDGRYLNGAYYMLTDKDDNFMASTGWYMYQDETEGDVALALTRTITHPNYRGTRGKVNLESSDDTVATLGMIKHRLFAPTLRAIKAKHQGKIWITFNGKNVTFIKHGLRQKKFNKSWSSDLGLEDIKYENLYLGEKFIHYTWQHVLELHEIKD